MADLQLEAAEVSPDAKRSRRWWTKFIDVEEAKTQIWFSIPTLITYSACSAIPVVSLMLAGHLGELQLAASTLGQSWAAGTGFSFVIGLSGSLETLCGQGYGAKEYRMLGIYLQANCIISFFFSIAISILWFFSDTILITLHQDPRISEEAGIYLKHLIPGIFAYGFLQNILRFLQTQSLVVPMIVCTIISLFCHIGIAYALVHCTSLGFRGAPLAYSISMCILVVMLSTYVLCSKKAEHTWTGFSSESFNHILSNLKLALPSVGMLCLEFWAFELLVILAGLMPNSEITTSLAAMCINTELVAFMIVYGLNAAASTRVSNELGAGNPGRAKGAMIVTLKLCFLLALLVDSALGFGHNIWAGLFSNSFIIKKKFAAMTPFLVVSIIIDYFQGVLSGVARGTGRQHGAFRVNLAAFYLIGMPIACLLGFKLKLHVKGLWIGLICGLTCQASGLFLLARNTKWARRVDQNKDLAQPCKSRIDA